MFELAFTYTSVFKLSFPGHEFGIILFVIIALEHFKSFYSQNIFLLFHLISYAAYRVLICVPSFSSIRFSVRIMYKLFECF